jgi:Zn-dependent protease with chaperone function
MDLAAFFVIAAAGIPWAFASFLVVVAISFVKGGNLLVQAWFVSGVFVLIPASERLLVRGLQHLRPPTQSESRTLLQLWAGVARRAGIDPNRHTLWVQEAPTLNADASGGRIIAVTHAALGLPRVALAAVLAHELGHHVGGHAWIRLLTYWYSLPARLIVPALKRAGTVLVALRLRWLVALLLLIAGALLLRFAASWAAPTLLALLALPSLNRWIERRCDRFAADLGFGPELLETLRRRQSIEDRRVEGPSLSRWLSSRPTIASRISYLESYLVGEQPQT